MKNQSKKTAFINIIGGLITGFLVAIINPGTSPIIGFLTAGVITTACLFLLQFIIRKLNGNRQLTMAVFIAFFLRF